MALDTVTSMTVFRNAVEAGSLAAAARRTDMTAEMAGRHLRSLETRLGVRLLNRSTRKLGLTDAGRAYLARCTAVLDEIALAEAEAWARQGEARGHVRVAAPLAFSTSALAPLVDAFLARHADVTVSLDLSEREADLVEGGFDVALRLGTLPDSGLAARRLGAFSLLAVGSPAYLVSHEPIVRPGDLARHDCLIYTQTSTPDRWSFTDERGHVEVVATSGRLQASDIGFLVEAASLGGGPLLAPVFAVAEAFRGGRLVPILPGWRARTLPFHAVLPHRRLVPAAVRSFVDFVADRFRDGSAGAPTTPRHP